MAKNFPDVIFNSPEDKPVLRRIFSYEAAYYNLADYERVSPGAGMTIWNMIEAEREHLKKMQRSAVAIHRWWWPR